MSFKMKSLLVAIISFLFFAIHSCSGRLLENSLFIASANPSAFDPNLNSVIDDGSRLENDAIPRHCDQEISPWSSSSEKKATKLDENKLLSFRLSPASIQNNNKADELPSASNKADGVFHLLPKGKVTPSGPSPKVNSMVTGQRLSKSKRSPGVGHMQMVRFKSPAINGDILKSHHSKGDEKKIKRKLGSTPSP